MSDTKKFLLAVLFVFLVGFAAIMLGAHLLLGELTP